MTLQAEFMAHMILEGPDVTTKRLQAVVHAVPGVSSDLRMKGIMRAASQCKAKGWITMPRRGTYQITAKGRKVWEPLLDKELIGAQ